MSRATTLSIVFLAGLLNCGCSSSKTHPVSGKVTVDGKPAAGAIVVLHPVDNPTTMERKPTASVREDGTFVVGTLTEDDGAAPGEYYVTVVWPGKSAPSKANTGGGRGEEAEGETGSSDQLADKYRDPKTSGLKATIKPERNQLPEFKLSK